MVRNAGHILVYGQPETAYDPIDRFISDNSLNDGSTFVYAS